MRRTAALWGVRAALALASATSARGQTPLHGFVQGSYALRAVDADCPATFDCAVMRAEERLQVKIEQASRDGRAGALARLDLFHDALRAQADVEVRELSADVNLGRFSARLGRQVVTWGLGELLFVNDVFSKDWVAFLTGAPLEYLKLGSDALRLGIYPPFANAEVVVSPVFQPDRVPSGSPLFFFDPMSALTNRTTERPAVELDNMPVAGRLYRSFGRFEAALYASRGFYGTPGARPDNPAAPGQLILFHPRLATYGASLQGPALGGVLSFEGGYYESLQDRPGTDPSIENSQARGLLAYQLQPWTDGSLSVQYYVEAMMKHDAYRASLPPGLPARDRYRHVASFRLRQLGLHQTLQLGLFALLSPSDQDLYLNPSVRYQVTDELWAEVGGNVFSGKEPHTFFGQFEKNSHVYVTVRYAF
ncbi:MAG: hypothetical protein HY700_10245 [Gemmatimonadetes bacterium]|nr:hypothetical protein [Gemmatimonadota bacterium]